MYYIIGLTRAQGQPILSYAKWYLYVTISGLTLGNGFNLGSFSTKILMIFDFENCYEIKNELEVISNVSILKFLTVLVDRSSMIRIWV